MSTNLSKSFQDLVSVDENIKYIVLTTNTSNVTKRLDFVVHTENKDDLEYQASVLQEDDDELDLEISIEDFAVSKVIRDTLLVRPRNRVVLYLNNFKSDIKKLKMNFSWIQAYDDEENIEQIVSTKQQEKIKQNPKHPIQNLTISKEKKDVKEILQQWKEEMMGAEMLKLFGVCLITYGGVNLLKRPFRDHR